MMKNNPAYLQPVIPAFIAGTHLSVCSNTDGIEPWVAGVNPAMTNFGDAATKWSEVSCC